MSKSKKSIDRIISISLLICSTLISLFIAEFFLRLKNSNMQNYDVEMWRYSKELKEKNPNKILDFVHKKNKTAKLQNVSIRINNLGLRGPNISVNNYDNKKRILFLGGSITLGWGVDESNILTSNIKRRFSEIGEDVEILNAGIGNYNTERYTERFLKNLYFLNPSEIVVNFFIRDAEDLKPSKSNFLLRKSQLALTLWTANNSFFKPKGEDSLINHYKSIYDKNSPGYKKMKNSLFKLSEYAKSKDIKIYILMVPDIYDLKNYKYLFIHELIKEIALEYNYIYVDSLPLFKNREFETLNAMKGDRHPNALGHKIMADAIFPFLIQNK